ncbi:MAG TPA: cobalamin-binding protein [Pyrinomonadaceae bacterium]|nr:cobalamin-binding protein [Pyrinomonadaceae bacterium]
MTCHRFGLRRPVGGQKSGGQSPPSKTLLLILVLAFLQGCTPRQNSITPEGPVRRQITDDSGKAVSLAIPVNRVVSLAPNLTEIVFAVGGGDRLVGRTSYCDFPSETKAVPEVGDTLHPSLERIIALKPQAVLVSTASQLEVFTKQLQAHDIAVFVTDPHDLEGVFRSIEKVGEILGLTEEAKQLVNTLKQRTGMVEEKTKGAGRVRVFYQLSAEPLYTAGRDSFVNDLINRAGGVSVTADVPGAWPKYSAEAALASKPDAIILPTGGSMGDSNTAVAEPLNRSPAVLNGRVYKINDDHLVRPGPRAVDGLEEMARALHPEAFKE